jgi:hypothetical protein
MAPVFPALIHPEAKPSLTALKATLIDEFGFLRIATDALSFIVTTSGACKTDTNLLASDGASLSNPFKTASSPTSRVGKANSVAARTAPATATLGPKSPPIASSAIGSLSLIEVDDTKLLTINQQMENLSEPEGTGS